MLFYKYIICTCNVKLFKHIYISNWLTAQQSEGTICQAYGLPICIWYCNGWDNGVLSIPQYIWKVLLAYPPASRGVDENMGRPLLKMKQKQKNRCQESSQALTKHSTILEPCITITVASPLVTYPLQKQNKLTN